MKRAEPPRRSPTENTDGIGQSTFQPRNADANLSPAVEQTRVTGPMQNDEGEHIPLAVAAAIVLHQVHPDVKALAALRDYEAALNIVAVALSRLITVYTLNDGLGQRRAAFPIDLNRQRITHGATEVLCDDGSTTARLSVMRSEMHSAISLIRRAGLPLDLASLPVNDVRGN